MSFTSLTPGQLAQVKKMADDKGIGSDRFQEYGLDNGTIATALDAVKLGRGIMIVSELAPPPGGRIHILRVRWVLDREWQKAITAAGPNTPDDYDVRRVGDLYLPTGKGVIENKVILMNFGPKGGSWDKAIDWGKQSALKQTDPRLVFAIGKHCPQLHHELKMDPMYVVATEKCSFEGNQRACDVWWRGTERKAHLRWVSLYGRADDWFAFSRESVSLS